MENKHSYAGYHNKQAMKYGDITTSKFDNSTKKYPTIKDMVYDPPSPQKNFSKKLKTNMTKRTENIILRF